MRALSSSSLVSPGTYVMFKGKRAAREMNRWIASSDSAAFFDSYGDYDKEEEVVEFDIATLVTASKGKVTAESKLHIEDGEEEEEDAANKLVVLLLKVLFPSKSDLHYSEGDRMIISNSSVIASLQHPFLGSYVYAMTVSNGISGSGRTMMLKSGSKKGDGDVIGIIDIRSVNPKSAFNNKAALPRRCQFQVVVKKSKDAKSKKYSFTIKSASVGLSEKHIRKMKFMLRNYIEDSLGRQMGLMESRFEQQRAYTRDVTKQVLNEQRRERDKVLNPEKYRSRSPTVRRAASGSGEGGSGRYRPSPAAQSRRVVKRG